LKPNRGGFRDEQTMQVVRSLGYEPIGAIKYSE
jgi:hypothetical protein